MHLNPFRKSHKWSTLILANFIEESQRDITNNVKKLFFLKLQTELQSQRLNNEFASECSVSRGCTYDNCRKRH